MTVLVAYASKHGATQGIAERIAATLTAFNLDVELHHVKEVENPARFDAFVIGSAVYYGSWMKEAADFVRQRQPELATRPVWLFSSGPIGSATTDAEGRDVRESAEPKELSELREALHPREHVVFFGALDPEKYGITERLLRVLPAGKKMLVEGDFRDWDEIERWAAGIARALTTTRPYEVEPHQEPAGTEPNPESFGG